MKSKYKELFGASSMAIILSALKNEDNYGYEIVHRVYELTNGVVKWQEPTIYPVLKKLESMGMIQSYWKVEEGTRPRRYYSILPEGKEQLKKNMLELQRVNDVFGNLMNPVEEKKIVYTRAQSEPSITHSDLYVTKNPKGKDLAHRCTI